MTENRDAEFVVGQKIERETANNEIVEGCRVVSDDDAGRVLRTHRIDDEEIVFIGWDSGVKTWTPRSLVRLEDADD